MVARARMPRSLASATSPERSSAVADTMRNSTAQASSTSWAVTAKAAVRTCDRSGASWSTASASVLTRDRWTAPCGSIVPLASATAATASGSASTVRRSASSGRRDAAATWPADPRISSWGTSTSSSRSGCPSRPTGAAWAGVDGPHTAAFAVAASYTPTIRAWLPSGR